MAQRSLGRQNKFQVTLDQRRVADTEIKGVNENSLNSIFGEIAN